MNDKRKHKRHETRDLLTVVDRETAQPIADLANLSPDGAMFITRESVKIGHLFKCRLELPQPILGRSDIWFDAECRWCMKTKTPGQYESGFSLMNVSELDSEVISYLILRCVIDEWSYPDAGSAPKARGSVRN